jgi:hypothetical protein
MIFGKIKRVFSIKILRKSIINFKLRKVALLTNKCLILLVDEERNIYVSECVKMNEKENIIFGYMSVFSRN